MPGQNWHALAFQALQDYINSLSVTSTSAASSAAATKAATSGGGTTTSSSSESTPFNLYLNGALVPNNSANLNNALPPAASGYADVAWQVDNTVNPPNISASYLVGTPQEVGTIDLTGQSAAISAAALYTPSAIGGFRVSYYAKVTTAATVSSVLGGSTGFILAYTDGIDSTSQTVTLSGASQTGTPIVIATGNTTNTTAAVYQGTGFIYSAAAAITYSFGYTSSGSTAMKFELHVRIESL